LAKLGEEGRGLEEALQGIRQEINNNLLKRSKFNLERHEREALIVSESLKTLKEKKEKGKRNIQGA
jgi:hypothetical protein